jgi:hypothetical protein
MWDLLYEVSTNPCIRCGAQGEDCTSIRPVNLDRCFCDRPELLQEPFNKIGEPTAVLVRADLFDKVGLFNENLRQLVDMEMWVCLMASHVGYIPRALTSVRVHAQQASNHHTTEEMARFERDSLQDTLRTSAIYPLLHWRVRCALRFGQLWRNGFRC